MKIDVRNYDKLNLLSVSKGLVGCNISTLTELAFQAIMIEMDPRSYQTTESGDLKA